MEGDIRTLYIMIISSFIFTLLLFGIIVYTLNQYASTNEVIIENYNILTGIVESQLNVSKILTERIDSYLFETSRQMDVVRTEDNANFFRMWLLSFPKKKRDIIEGHANELNTSCISSIDGIDFNDWLFTMQMTLTTGESRTIRISESALTCHYFTMEIPCETFCETRLAEINQTEGDVYA